MDLQEKAYLFVYFTGESEEGEQIYFSLSRDGLHWTDLNGGKPVLRSGIGEQGVRDPYILRSKLDGRFYIMATDLRIASGKGWAAARSRGSKRIILWTSSDLTGWSEPWEAEVAPPGAGCAWAPEACFDEKRQAYLVFWASLVKEEGEAEPKHRIFCSYTKDFRSFSAPQKYMEKEEHVIDMTIVRDAGKYYRFTKDAATGGIVMDYSTDLQGQFHPVSSESLRSVTGVEGPLAFLLPDREIWCLMADRFAQRLGYLPMLCRNLETGSFWVPQQTEYDLGGTRKRHGSVLMITREERERLCLKYPVCN